MLSQAAVERQSDALMRIVVVILAAAEDWRRLDREEVQNPPVLDHESVKGSGRNVYYVTDFNREPAIAQVGERPVRIGQMLSFAEDGDGRRGVLVEMNLTSQITVNLYDLDLDLIRGDTEGVQEIEEKLLREPALAESVKVLHVQEGLHFVLSTRAEPIQHRFTDCLERGKRNVVHRDHLVLFRDKVVMHIRHWQTRKSIV